MGVQCGPAAYSSLDQRMNYKLSVLTKKLPLSSFDFIKLHDNMNFSVAVLLVVVKTFYYCRVRREIMTKVSNWYMYKFYNFKSSTQLFRNDVI